MAREDVFRGFGSYDPFEEMQRLQDEVNRLFSTTRLGPSGGAFPPVNAFADEHGVAITAQLPGVAGEDLDISVFRDTLTLRGKRPGPPPEAKAYHRRERGHGEFVRNIALPFRVDPERVEANMQEGILRVSLHRPEEDKPRRIKISG